MSFVEDLAAERGVPSDHPLVRYLVRKTKAADRGSKARRSLGNLYALLVLIEDYREGKASRFTDLLRRMKAKPFGSKLQNHPLDNRLNDEFKRQIGLDGSLLPVQVPAEERVRTISKDLLAYGGADPAAVAEFVEQAINSFTDQITANQDSALDEIEGIGSLEELCAFFDEAFAPNSDARLFEIVSYVLLAEHYRGRKVYIGDSRDSVQERCLSLYRAGRTNANDGGIDFILRPFGRIYQVTETLDFKKYFLDFEKVNRYPISFVIKIEEDKANVLGRIRYDALRSGAYSEEIVERYLSLFEEVFTLHDLKQIAGELQEGAVERVKEELALQFKLEYGLLD